MKKLQKIIVYNYRTLTLTKDTEFLSNRIIALYHNYVLLNL